MVTSIDENTYKSTNKLRTVNFGL